MMMKTKNSTISELVEKFDELMLDRKIVGFGNCKATGFTIGKGKKLYWYLTPYCSKKFVGYRCLPVEKHGLLGWPRRCLPTQKVVIHYERT
jgi:hypothetical protein